MLYSGSDRRKSLDPSREPRKDFPLVSPARSNACSCCLICCSPNICYSGSAPLTDVSTAYCPTVSNRAILRIPQLRTTGNAGICYSKSSTFCWMFMLPNLLFSQYSLLGPCQQSTRVSICTVVGRCYCEYICLDS